MLAFACYAFVVLPLGRRTAWGHLKAIFRTPAAREAANEVPKALRRTVDAALGKNQPEARVATAARQSDPSTEAGE